MLPFHFSLLLLLVSASFILVAHGTAIKVGDLEFNLGEEKGISKSSSVTAETLKRILEGVERENADNIYFYGLLKLYGLAVALDIPGAAQQFLRASSLGHKDATTAYGVMLISGHLGPKDDVKAIQYFRQAVSLGDMVSSS
jgi:hypothetical protein